MTRSLRLTAVLVVFALAALVGLQACGGGGGSDESVDKLLAQTFGPNKPVRSGFLDLRLNLDLQGVQNLSGPVGIKLRGPFQSAGKDTLPSFDFTANLSASGQDFSAGAVSTGEKGYLRFQGRTFVLSDKIFQSFKRGYEQAQKQSKSKDSGPSFKSLGIDPRRWLKDAKKSGEEEVGGADTIHISAGIDVPKFLDDVSTLLKRADRLGVAGTTGQKVPNGLTAKQREAILRAVKSAKIDLFTGKDDKTLRRLAIAVDIAVPEADRSKAAGLSSGKVTFELTIANLNKDQTIKEPKGARPLAELTGQIGQLFGGTAAQGGGTATTPSTGGTGGTGGTSAAPQEYLDCLQKAGQDVAEVQKCAELLTPGG